ncbi:MAG: substrate-binding domain-containing protein [Thermofilum sp.]
MGKRLAAGVLVVLLFVSLYLVLTARQGESGEASQRSARRVLVRVATTTSLDASGLLDTLKREFEIRHPGIEVVWVAVGTGQALEMARRGDVDLVLTHDRELEDRFISEGYGVHGVTFACNEFYVLGPPEDPAGVSGARSAAEAFSRVYSAGEAGRAVFVSRGDNSGTHLKELSLWSSAGLSPGGKPWYRETGQGMAQTLMVADQLRAYTLCDSSTYAAFASRVGLKVLFRGDLSLRNFYRAILVNPERFPWVSYSAAHEFVKFVVSPEGQRAVSEHRKGGLQLFEACFGRFDVLELGGPYEREQVEYWEKQLSG